MTLLSTGTDYEQLAAAFRPIFSRIAQGAANREQHRILPDEQIRWLKEAGSARFAFRGKRAAGARRCRS